MDNDILLIDRSTDYMTEFNNLYKVFYNDYIITEGPVLTGLVSLGVATSILGRDRVIDFFKNLINVLIKAIQFIIDSIQKIWKAITINAKDVYNSNERFLFKYGARLSKMNNIIVTEEGYSISKDIMAILNMLNVEYKNTSNDVEYISNILNGEAVFNSESDVMYLVNKNRSDILDINKIGSDRDYGSIIKDRSEFKDFFKNKIYGDKYLNQYSVTDALHIIKSYNSRISLIADIKDNILVQAKKDITKLSNILTSIVNGRIIIKELKDNVATQFQHLMQFKQLVMLDFIDVFDIIADYINDINIQAKVICIKALQNA